MSRRALIVTAVGEERGWGHWSRMKVLSQYLLEQGWVVDIWLPDTDLSQENLEIPLNAALFNDVSVCYQLAVIDGWRWCDRTEFEAIQAQCKVQWQDTVTPPCKSTFIVNSNIGVNEATYGSYYQEQQHLLGVCYTPLPLKLQQQAKLRRADLYPFDMRVRVLLQMGTADTSDDYIKSLRLLAKSRWVQWLDVRVCLGGQVEFHEDLAQEMSKIDFLKKKIVKERQPMFEHYRWADMAIGSAGVSQLERLLMQIPSIIIPNSADQEISKLAAEQGWSSLLALCDDERLFDIDDFLCSLNERENSPQSECCMVDGRGAQRVLAEVEQYLSQMTEST